MWLLCVVSVILMAFNKCIMQIVAYDSSNHNILGSKNVPRETLNMKNGITGDNFFGDDKDDEKRILKKRFT